MSLGILLSNITRVFNNKQILIEIAFRTFIQMSEIKPVTCSYIQEEMGEIISDDS